jgi:hypothetical protein
MQASAFNQLVAIVLLFCASRYFLRKLRRVKKANGQIIAVNEVRHQQQQQQWRRQLQQLKQ